ncbi:MAG TPA: FAD-dependent oxidoreductase [Rhodoplanes sp.]|nr:FAD-dependent oxidoreductase [Rhodoplanes sp.]
MLFPKGAPFLPELEAELLAFPQGKTDDQVDSISWDAATTKEIAVLRHKERVRMAAQDRDIAGRDDFVLLGDCRQAQHRPVLWNELKPQRSPELIVRVKSAGDVAAAIDFARANAMKVGVRGGHSWCGLPLRVGGLLIDLSALDRISVDPANRTASVEPHLSNREVIRALAPHGLAFPMGHCPTVKASGFLLSGGIGWNSYRARQRIELQVIARRHGEEPSPAAAPGPVEIRILTRVRVQLAPVSRQ